jgi:hypothetical protein
MKRMWLKFLLSAAVLLCLAIGPHVAIGGEIISTFGSTWQGKNFGAAIQVNAVKTFSGRGCWQSSSLGAQECGQLVSARIPGALAWSFITPSTASADGIDVALGRLPQSSGNEVTIALHDDNSGLPGTRLQSVTVVDKMPKCYEGANPLTRGVFDAPYPLVNNQRYWVVVSMPASTGGRWGMNDPEHNNACTGDRVGTGARLWPPGSDTWEPYPAVNLLPNCSAAFRVTSP